MIGDGPIFQTTLSRFGFVICGTAGLTDHLDIIVRMESKCRAGMKAKLSSRDTAY